jgi:hypothetical protein
MGMIKSGEKYLLHLAKSPCGACMEKYPINTPYRACFLSIKDLLYVYQMTICMESWLPTIRGQKGGHG